MEHVPITVRVGDFTVFTLVAVHRPMPVYTVHVKRSRTGVTIRTAHNNRFVNSPAVLRGLCSGRFISHTRCSSVGEAGPLSSLRDVRHHRSMNLKASLSA